MTDDLQKRLEAQGSAEVPSAERTFADGLESKLRVQHSEVVGQRRPLVAWLTQWGLPRLGIAAAAVAFGVFAVVAITGGSAGIPVDVIDGESPPPASEPSGLGGDDEQDPAVDPTPTATEAEGNGPNALEPTAEPDATTQANDAPASPTARPTVASPVAPTEQPSADPIVPDPVPPPTAAPAPTRPTPVPTTPDRPAPTTDVPATAVPATAIPATAIQEPPRPVPRPTVIPTPTRPVPSPTVVPTPRPVVASIDLSCEVRAGADAVGVVCSWRPPQIDAVVATYQVLRTRNGSQAQIVSRQRAGADTTFVDRDLEFGDQVTYLVRARGAGDELIAESAREIVRIPGVTD